MTRFHLQTPMPKARIAAAACLLLFTPTASAACSHGLAERALAEYEAQQPQREAARMLAKRQQSAPTNLAQQEGLTDPVAECTPYYWSGSEAYQGQFPPIWQIATIVAGDTEAMNAYNAIVNAPGFPNLAPKGTPQGDFTGVQYDNSDPDCWWTWSKCVKPKAQGLPADVSTCPEPETWGLSYDDGPNCTHNAFYDYLKEKEFTATMFYIGSNVLNWPLQAQRGLADLHEIGIHTWSHRYSTALTNEQMFAELWYTRKAIKAVIGITPTTWRAPYGDVDDRVRAIAHGLGLTTVLWDHDTFDWQVQGPGNPNGLATATVEQNYNSMYGLQAQGAFSGHGAIVLSHEINQGTMDIAMQELPAIAGNFKHVVPVATCQNNSHPYNETMYRFPTFQEYLATNSSKMVNGSITAATTTAVSTITSAVTRSGSTSGTTSASSKSSGKSTSGSISGIPAAGAGVSPSTYHSSAQLTSPIRVGLAALIAAGPAIWLLF